jgi:hypothetical protein
LSSACAERRLHDQTDCGTTHDEGLPGLGQRGRGS